MSSSLTHNPSIRPVLRNFPSSEKCLNNSNLPFAVTICPLEEEEETTAASTRVQSLTGIPKCLYCGAPHAAGASTHFSTKSSGSLLCYLCGRSSSTLPQAQAAARQSAEESTNGNYYNCTSDTSTVDSAADPTFCLPLRLRKNSKTYEVSALACPPLWLVVLDGSCTDPTYWKRMSEVLAACVTDAPSHVQLGLLIASGTSTLGLFDLQSAVPHVRHLHDEDGDLVNELLAAHLGRIDSPHVATAIRSVMDYQPPTTSNPGGAPVAWTTQALLDALSSQAVTAGSRLRDDDDDETKLAYAGAKLTFLLTTCPSGLKPPAAASHNASFMMLMLDDDESNSELTPSALQAAYGSSHAADAAEYEELGRQCADAAMGVDLLCLYDSDLVVPAFGLGVCHALSLKSGAPGPVLLDWNEEEEQHSSTAASLTAQVLSRTPWQASLVFGAELRLRMSPGFLVDTTTKESEQGLVGPASSVSQQLWRMGVTDPHTALTIDLTVADKHVPDRFHVDGFGEVALKPVLQTCLAYTTIVKDDKDGSYKTVRQMRIRSRPVPLVRTAEELYGSLDTEALAVVLFHKICLASFEDDGLKGAATMAQQWLVLLLSCAYKSAEEQEKVQMRQLEHGLAEKNRYFIANERLLHLEGGELSTEDVLLCQGHERLRPISLMVYLLLRCRPLYLSGAKSMDERCVALQKMVSMTPSNLTRCIAPRIQLWESGKHVEEPIVEVIELRSEAIQSAVLEHSANAAGTGLILFVDTPQLIFVMNASCVNTGSDGSSASSRKQRLVVGSGLERAIEDATASYRCRPLVVNEIEDDNDEQALKRLAECVVEDSPNAVLEAESFAEWKALVARQVEE